MEKLLKVTLSHSTENEKVEFKYRKANEIFGALSDKIGFEMREIPFEKMVVGMVFGDYGTDDVYALTKISSDAVFSHYVFVGGEDGKSVIKVKVLGDGQSFLETQYYNFSLVGFTEELCKDLKEYNKAYNVIFKQLKNYADRKLDGINKSINETRKKHDEQIKTDKKLAEEYVKSQGVEYKENSGELETPENNETHINELVDDHIDRYKHVNKDRVSLKKTLDDAIKNARKIVNHKWLPNDYFEKYVPISECDFIPSKDAESYGTLKMCEVCDGMVFMNEDGDEFYGSTYPFVHLNTTHFHKSVDYKEDGTYRLVGIRTNINDDQKLKIASCLDHALSRKVEKTYNENFVETRTDDDSKVCVETANVDTLDGFDRLLGELRAIYRKKNNDYGSSFSQLFDEFGITSSVIRLSDKLNRFKELTSGTVQKVSNESLEDTLKDLANYALLTVLELRKR